MVETPRGAVQKRRKELLPLSALSPSLGSSPLLLQNEPECGVSKQNAFSKRIIGGERARFAELPWQVRKI